MNDKSAFECVVQNVNKYETRIEKYIIPILEKGKKVLNDDALELQDTKNENNEQELAAFENSAFIEDEPKLCIWTYMNKEDVETMLQLRHKSKRKNMIEAKIQSEYPKGRTRKVAIELIYSVAKFCKKSNFNLEQSGTILSLFHLTHVYFTHCLYKTAEDTYSYFKERLLMHCVWCPPDNIKLFNYQESKNVLLYFCKIYVRNLPLIRLLALPNYGFTLNFEKEEEPLELKSKGKKKDKKGAGKDKKKKSEKGSKKSKK